MLVVLNHIDEVPGRPARSRCSTTYAGCVDADGLDRRAGAGDQRAHRRGDRRAARRDRPTGSRPRRSPARGSRPTSAARRARLDEASGTERPPGAVARSGSPPSTTRSPTPPGCPTVVEAVESATRRARPAARPAGRSRPGSPGCGPTRSSGSTSTSARTGTAVHRPRAHLRARPRPRCSAPASTAEVRAVADEVSAPLTRPWAESVRRASVSRLPDLNDRLDAALAATELDAEPDPGLGRARAGAPVAAAARRARRGRAGSACWSPTATSASPSRPRPTWPASRCRPCCCSAGSCSGIVLALLCRLAGLGDGPLAGALGRPPAAVGDRRGGRRAGRRAGAGRARGVRRRCARASARALK